MDEQVTGSITGDGEEITGFELFIGFFLWLAMAIEGGMHRVQNRICGSEEP